jgi:hypothetical protein
MEDSVIAAVQFVHDLLTSEKHQAVMAKCVISDRMVPRCNV